ncbi:MAG: type I polyketide synthase [Caldilineaceae bacterium]
MSEQRYATLIKSAQKKIKHLQTELDALKQRQHEPLAVIGMSCRLPGGANDPEAFWRLLQAGVDTVQEVPPERWDIEAYYDPDPDAMGKMYSRYASFLDQVDQFEPQFFGIAPREAQMIDPQQRLLLEVCWEALERANLVPAHLRGSNTGVFIGMMNQDYMQLLGQPTAIDAHTAGGNALSVASGRISFILGLQGPTLTVDTACSSSLVAVHLACQSLRNQEADMAIAAGVNLILSPTTTIAESRARMLAPDGRCKTFDAAADGMGRGEGCGVVVIKRLSAALADGDPIVALIRGSAVNHDGPSSALTVPNELAQEALIRRALAHAGVHPNEISYIEAHGTGTALGDPIEIGALGSVFGQERSQPLWVGSVKTNFGHLEGAAGVAGLLKAILALQHRQIPPHLHLQQPNPHIPWADLPIQVPTTPTPLPDAGRLAGVSSFGLSGTNAHIVLEAAPELSTLQPDAPQPLLAPTTPPQVLTLSATSESALIALAGRYATLLAEQPALALADLCLTANTQRTQFSHRLAVVAATNTQMCEQLTAIATGSPNIYLGDGRGIARGNAPAAGRPKAKIAFLFTGQGSEYLNMGRALYTSQPLFRQIMEQCDAILRPYLKRSLLALLYPDQAAAACPEPGHNDALIHTTAYTQPALFAVEYALAKVWQAWGIEPQAVLGHSVGEYVAACLAGVFSLEDALLLIAERGRLMHALFASPVPGAEEAVEGQMVALFAPLDQVRAALAPYHQEVAVAAINGPQSIVISGRAQAVTEIVADLNAQGVKSQKLPVAYAFHSPLMAPMLAEFRQVASAIHYAVPTMPLISNLTGKPATAQIATADYWCRHILQPVRFADGMSTLQELGIDTFVEIGPKPILVAMGQRCLLDYGAWLPSLRPEREWLQLLTTLGELYVRGAPVTWTNAPTPLVGQHPRGRVILPTYPWQRQSYWLPAASGSGHQEEQDNAPASSPAGQWSSIFELLHQGQVKQVAAQLVNGGQFSAAEAQFAEKVLGALQAQHQQQLLAQQLDDWLYTIEWQAKPYAADRAAAPTPLAGQWLILTTQTMEQAFAEWAAATQRTAPAPFQPIFVVAGAHYARENTNRWMVDPTDPTAFARLLQEIDAPLQGVIHGWSLQSPAITARDEQSISSAFLAESQNWGVVSILHLLQALVTQPRHNSQTLRLWLVTAGAAPVTSAPLAVEQAPIWGLGKVIALEHPELWGGLLDVDPTTPRAEQVDDLLGEIEQTEHNGEMVAFRKRERYVARLAPYRLAPFQSDQNKSCALRPDGSYLITGGLGALGLQVAHFLVQQGARQLILTSRRAANTAAQAKIDALRAAGANVQVVQADVGQPQEVARLLQGAPCPIRGVVHAAGVLDDGILLRQSAARFQQVMAAKVDGAWNLHTAFLQQDEPLDFFVMFSSIAALLGSPGQGNYAAANAFMDALAFHRHALGLSALSINWGPWAEAGMAAGTDAQGGDLIALTPAQGLHIFGQLMVTTHAPQVAVLPFNSTRLRQGVKQRNQLPLFAAVVDSASAQANTAPIAAAPVYQEWEEAQREARLIAHVQEQVGFVLGLAAPDLEQGFNEMGMDSLMALELKKRLEASLKLALPATLAFEYPTIQILASHLNHDVLRWSIPDGETVRTKKATEALLEAEQLMGEEADASLAAELAELESLLLRRI